MGRTGRAAVFLGPGLPFEIRELPLPELEPGAVLVRVTLANVCGSDLHFWHFWRGDAPLALPPDGWIFGHEMTGQVAALGAGVGTDSLGRPLREGDRVAFCYFYPCGRCYVCLHTFPLERIDEAFREAEWHNRDAASSRITRAALAP